MSYEHDALISTYQHLSELTRAAEALQTLRKIASLVKPIMRKHGWHVRTLAEFWPTQQNLLGLNVNGGEKIFIRLRHAGDKSQFMPLEQVTDTMLHELCHNVHGPHDQKFHALWDQLRGEYDDLVRKGYSGEGFLGNGQQVGGRRMPMHEMRRQARIAAERRNLVQKGSGQRLGGAPANMNVDIRAVIANAAARRMNITQGCGSQDQQQGRQAVDEANRNGFRTKAEEDDANERAIAQALWELVQEDESQKLGLSGPRSNQDGLSWDSENGLQEMIPSASRPLKRTRSPPPVPITSKPTSVVAAPLSADTWPCLVCTLVNYGEKMHCDACGTERRRISPPSAGDSNLPKTSPEVESTVWACPTCTLENRLQAHRCEACGSERPDVYNTSKPKAASSIRRLPTVADRDLKALALRADADAKARSRKLGWNCTRCGSFMEDHWWTCSSCGVMKSSST